MTEVKICGINDAEAFDTAVEAGADYVGFVFFPRSPRCISPHHAAILSARHDGGPRRVGLFVEPRAAEIAAVLAAVRLDALQLYVSPDRAAELGMRFRRPVWRAVGVAQATDLPHDARGSDLLLIEAKPPPGATRPGGNATVFDWSILTGWNVPSPWGLGGGLTPHNVAEAIRVTGAPLVDVSSGVEIARGQKDPTLIRAFITAVRDCFP